MKKNLTKNLGIFFRKNEEIMKKKSTRTREMGMKMKN